MKYLSNPYNQIRLFILTVLSLLLLASCGGGSGSSGGASNNPINNGQSTTPTLVSLQITSENNSTVIPAGGTRQFFATGTMSDGTTVDVTSDPSTTWSSDNQQILAITSTGVNDAPAGGIVTAEQNSYASSAKITATYNGVLSNSQAIASTATEVTVVKAVPSSIETTSTKSSTKKVESITIPIGITAFVYSTTTFTDGQTANTTCGDLWSYNEESGVIEASRCPYGHLDYQSALSVLGKKAGTSEVTVRNKVGIADSTPLVVTVSNLYVKSIALTSDVTGTSTDNINAGTTKQFRVTAILNDGESRDITNDPNLTWKIDNANVATVTNFTNPSNMAGQVTARSYANGKAANLTATFNDKLGHNVSSSIVLNVISGVAESIVITKTKGSSLAVKELTVLPIGVSTYAFSTTTYTDGSSADNTCVDYWSVKGGNPQNVFARRCQPDHPFVYAYGLKSGLTTITVRSKTESHVTYSIPVKVTNQVITKLEITQYNETIPAGDTKQFRVVGTFSDGTTESKVDLTNDPNLNWYTDTNNIATVTKFSGGSNTGGLVTAAYSGAHNLLTNVNAEFNDRAGHDVFAPPITIKVVSAVAESILITPNVGSTTPYNSPTDMPLGVTQFIYSTTIKTDGTTVDNTCLDHWKVDEAGLAGARCPYPNKDGTRHADQAANPVMAVRSTKFGEYAVQVRHREDNSITDSVKFNVRNYFITSIKVTGNHPSLKVGHEEQLHAIGTFGDGSTVDLTNDPNTTWQSSSTNVAVSNFTVPSKKAGVATANTAGSSIITVEFNDQLGHVVNNNDQQFKITVN